MLSYAVQGCSRVPVDGYPFWMPSAPGRTGEDHPSVQTTISVARGLAPSDWPSVSRRQVRVLCRLDGDRGKTRPRRAGVLAGPPRGLVGVVLVAFVDTAVWPFVSGCLRGGGSALTLQVLTPLSTGRSVTGGRGGVVRVRRHWGTASSRGGRG